MKGYKYYNANLHQWFSPKYYFCSMASETFNLWANPECILKNINWLLFLLQNENTYCPCWGKLYFDTTNLMLVTSNNKTSPVKHKCKYPRDRSTFSPILTHIEDSPHMGVFMQILISISWRRRKPMVRIIPGSDAGPATWLIGILMLERLGLHVWQKS